jgi:hypothetical protein
MGFGASDALVRRRTRRGLLGTVAVAVPVVLGVLGEVTRREELQFLAALIGLAEAVGFLLLPAIAPDGILKGERRGRVRADRTGVFFRDKLVLARDRIQTPWVEALAGGARCVHLSGARARDDLAIVVEDDGRVRSLLEALELRHDRHAASFVVESAPLRTPSSQRLARALVFLGSASLAAVTLFHAYRSPLVGFALVPVLVVYSMIVRRARLMSRLVIGADGFVVRAGGALRQIPHASVRSVSTCPRAESIVELVTGEVLTLRFAGEGANEKSLTFAARLQEGVALANRAPEGPVAALLQPAGRCASEWLADLRRITSDCSGYRGGAVPDEELWRVIEHAGADSGARAGAVAALRPRLDESGRARIAELAGGTARRDLKAALEAAAAGESEEHILAAFERGSAEPKPRA